MTMTAEIHVGDTITVTCAGCDTSFPYVIRHGGRHPKWCSERCRKRSYDLECPECGGRMDGTTPSKGPKRCRHCEEGRNAERNEELMDLWEAGTPVSEIAEQLAMTEDAVYTWVDKARRRDGRRLTLRRRPGLSAEEKVRLRRMLTAGATPAEIAVRFGYRNEGSAKYAVYWHITREDQ